LAEEIALSYQWVNDKVKALEIPVIMAVAKTGEITSTDNLNNCTTTQLGDKLAFFGAWKGFLESELSAAETRRDIVKSILENDLTRTIFEVAKNYRTEGSKVPNKEMLRAEAIATSELYQRNHSSLTKLEALCTRLVGYRNQYRAYYETVSRIIAIRTSNREEI
tara:strand:+ start:18219 stop:18710 length:492 start_codon:yes stop_codon:yes gene_type:complete